MQEKRRNKKKNSGRITRVRINAHQTAYQGRNGDVKMKKEYEKCPQLQSGHSAYFKNKSEAKKCAKEIGAKLKKTKHTIRGKGWLIYK